MGVPPESVLRLRQVHGARVVVVRGRDGGRTLEEPPPEADILVSDDPGVALSVRVADCMPVLLADRRSGAVAAAHAGWRGTSARVVRAAVESLVSAFGSAPSDLVAAIGPSIGPCCYRVGSEVVEAFKAAGMTRAEQTRWFLEEPAGTSARPGGAASADTDSAWELAASDFRLPTRDQLARFPGQDDAGRTEVWADLWTASLDQLASAGLAPEHVHLARLCTACHPALFHSYRRDKTSLRTVGVIRAVAGAH